MQLPTDCISHIVSYLPLSYLYRLRSWIRLDESRQRHLLDRLQWIEGVPPYLRHIFGMDRLLDASSIIWKERFIGWTGYIDRLCAHDVDSPIAVGTDNYGRRFISLRTHNITIDTRHVVTMFQRYSDDMHTWTYGSSTGVVWTGSGSYFLQKNRINSSFFERLSQLLHERYISKDGVFVLC